MDSTTCTAFPKVLATPTSRRQALKVLTATTGVFLGLSALGTALSSCQEQQLSQQSVKINNGGVTPEQVKAALPTLEHLVKETLQKTGVPAIALAVVFQDEVLFL